MSTMTVVVTPETSEGSACGSSTLRTIVGMDPPIDWTASTSPWSTSRTAVSTSRAKKGMAPTASGTIIAVGPMKVPTTKVVKGIRAISRMMNGSERPMFTITPMTLFTGVLRSSPPLSVRTSRTPSGSPTRTVTAADQSTM